MQGILSDASVNVIKREIIKTLSLETENETDLEDGDNYVPVTITDLRGNKTEYKFNVACTMTRNNSQDINIDNNVNVNVW